MSTKCPYCGKTDVKCLNWGRRITAGVAGGATAAVMSIFMRNGAKEPAKEVHKSICDKREYICVNCCKKFEENIF